MNQKITYCIPSKNNLRYLKSSIGSIKENSSQEFDIIVYVDSDNDGTKEWLDSEGVKYLVNETNIPRGIAYGYNRCIEAAETPIVCMFHADMYMGRGFDTAILKYLKPLSVVSGTRIEPPLHPKGNEKIVENFGMYPEDFLKEEFDGFVQKTIQENEGKTTRGIFAPWAVYKEDITSIGMHDEFFHSYHEDSDIFNRFILNGYDIVQTWEGLVYHLTCRGGQFQDGIEQVTQDPKFHLMKHNAAKNYVRKWGHFVKNDEFQYPIIPPKYDIQFDIQNCNLQLLSMLEPWCSKIKVDLSSDMIENYIRSEQGNTKIDLSEKINSEKEGDIIISFDASKVNQQSFQYIQQLPEIFEANQITEGTFEFDIFDVKINKVKTYQDELIRL
jgi:glycosyltransferase involved in cell wall biosynthesis